MKCGDQVQLGTTNAHTHHIAIYLIGPEHMSCQRASHINDNRTTEEHILFPFGTVMK